MPRVSPLRPAEQAQALVASIKPPIHHVDIDEVTRDLPDTLGFALELILSELDLSARQKSPTAAAARLLAALIARYTEASQ